MILNGWTDDTSSIISCSLSKEITMVVRIMELEDRSPASTSIYAYSGVEVARILAQPGADSVGFIGFWEGGTRYEALIGKIGSELLNAPHQLAAKPCPPFCPDGQL